MKCFYCGSEATLYRCVVCNVDLCEDHVLLNHGEAVCNQAALALRPDMVDRHQVSKEPVETMDAVVEPMPYEPAESGGG